MPYYFYKLSHISCKNNNLFCLYIYIYILFQIAHVGAEIRSPTQVRWIDIV